MPIAAFSAVPQSFRARIARSIAPRLALLVLAVAGLSASAGGQSLTFAEFGGTVRDASRQVVRDAEVRVLDRASGATRWTLTTRDGVFRFDALPAGRYDVTVEALGYRPVVHLDVRIAAGPPTRLDAALQLVPPPVTTIDTIPRLGDGLTAGNWLVERGFGDLVGERRIGADLTAFSTIADEFSVEGLPWRLAESLVDGARSGGLGAPGGIGADAAGLALPVRALSAARVGGLGYDVEVGGTGVGLRATTLRGGSTPSTRMIAEGGSANVGGAFIAGGPLQGDTAQAIFGGDYQYGERDLVPAAPGIPARTSDRASLFGRLDWQPSDRLAVSARASGSRYTSLGWGERTGVTAAYGTDYEGLGAQASLNIYGRLTRRIAHEWRVSTDFGTVEGRDDGFFRSDMAANGAQGGPLLVGSYQDDRTTPRVSGMLHFDFGAHRLKMGFATASHRFNSRFARGSEGFYAVDAPIIGSGAAWLRTENPSFAGEFRMNETALFVQDAWQVADGLSLILGARIDNTRIPVGDIEPNAEWFALSALDNTAARATRSNLSPRVGLRWELGARREWVIEGGAGTYTDLPDRRDIAEALTFDRGADVRYGFDVPFSSEAPLSQSPVVGRTLTMLAPSFTAPRTQRLSLGVTRRDGSWSTSLNAVYRHTDFLTRRRDLNLPATSVGADQYGRPLYGSLQQLETIVGVVAQSNRRFSSFDAVHALESTGFSEFWGLTGGVEYVRELGLSFGAHYTYSRTTDNVVSFGGAQLAPFAEPLQGVDWAEGTSDFDAPHRVLVAADWRPTAAISLGAVYRLRSGMPFTPMIAAGTDVNGDGDWGNDPAFVDEALAGMTELLGANSCLRSSNGRFAERNSCRNEFVQRLDLRASFRLGQLRIGRLDVVVDAMDVVAPNVGPKDRTLLIVDRNGALSTNATTGVTTVPFVVNPNFGNSLYDVTPGVFWRVGLRVTP